jgi:amidase
MTNTETPGPENPNQIDRRTFLRGGVAGSVLAAAAATGLRPSPALAHAMEPTSKRALAPVRIQEFELEEATIADLQDGMRTGRWTARGITELYLGRIEALDRQGPALRHVLETNPDALAIADGLDAERRAGRVRGLLHGIPILVKDNIDTADRMSTTAGSLALEGSVAQQDSFVAARLREAGAILLGKTNLSEWANFRSTRSSSGWSGRGGQGKNPYALDRSPCGSSSGSGGAVSASYAAVGIGTETDGSIVCPSNASSLVGLKPTLGLVSRSGIIPIAHSQDTAGPMARTVTDAAILLGALTGVDPRDTATMDSGEHAHTDYTRFLDADGLHGARIGVTRGRFFGYSPEADRLVEEAIEVMKQQGAVVIDPAEIPHVGEYDDSEFTVLLYEFKADLNAYLGALGPEAPVSSLADLIDFNEKNRRKEMPFFGQEIFHQAEEKGPLTEKEYVDALALNQRLSRGEGIDSVMAEHRLDALVAPTGSPPWTIDLVNGDHFLGASSTPAAVSGYPSITVPVGYSFGLPVGISFVGRAWSEPTLLKLAFALEQATKARRPPRYLPTADLSAV